MNRSNHINYLTKLLSGFRNRYSIILSVVITFTLHFTNLPASMGGLVQLGEHNKQHLLGVDSQNLGNSTSIESIPDEPVEYDPKEVKSYYDWRNDMFFREFDLEGMGRVDFMTARRTYKVSLNEYGNSVVMTMPYPLFYWVDSNKNGKFEPKLGEMWSDPEEDGVNGNENLYGI